MFILPHVAFITCFLVYLTFTQRKLLQESDSDCEVFDLLDPSSPDLVVGNIAVSCSVEVCAYFLLIGSILVFYFLYLFILYFGRIQ